MVNKDILPPKQSRYHTEAEFGEGNQSALPYLFGYKNEGFPSK